MPKSLQIRYLVAYTHTVCAQHYWNHIFAVASVDTIIRVFGLENIASKLNKVCYRQADNVDTDNSNEIVLGGKRCERTTTKGNLNVISYWFISVNSSLCVQRTLRTDEMKWMMCVWVTDNWHHYTMHENSMTGIRIITIGLLLQFYGKKMRKIRWNCNKCECERRKGKMWKTPNEQIIRKVDGVKKIKPSQSEIVNVCFRIDKRLLHCLKLISHREIVCGIAVERRDSKPCAFYQNYKRINWNMRSAHGICTCSKFAIFFISSSRLHKSFQTAMKTDNLPP